MTVENEVAAADLRCRCAPSLFDFETTAEIQPLDRVIGQERAVRAIHFGLEMKSRGYHIFVTGPEGTGKTTIVQEIVRKAAESLPTPPDWCMVNNFKDEYRPRALPVHPGHAARIWICRSGRSCSRNHSMSTRPWPSGRSSSSMTARAVLVTVPEVTRIVSASSVWISSPAGPTTTAV